MPYHQVMFVDWYFTIIDSVFLGIYVMECVLKLFVLRLEYFKDYWNLLGEF